MNRIKYVLSSIAVLLATLAILIAPDIAGAISSAQMNRETVFKSTVSPVQTPLTANEVANAYLKGDFLYNYTHEYTHEKLNYDELRASSVKVAQDLFAEEQYFCKEIIEIIRTDSISEADKISALVITKDRLATMEIVRIGFSSGLSMRFEKNTGLLFEFSYFPHVVYGDESWNFQSMLEDSAEAYYLSTISASDIKYEVICEKYGDYTYTNIQIMPGWIYNKGEESYEVIN
ncbi:MAG: hypothetical protein E7563_03920 [Ruminococcaceae bacterium]|nr:hypothetical protein [Oscillospiraceae bacterium]